jgi:DNA (cytosine-5)-methyltransferase 1
VNLVLSIFPGIDLLGRGFEEEGFCVVRGPDLIWGGDVRDFHPPAGVFDGVIGGPPCQIFSRLRHMNPNAGKKHGNMIPEFERVVREAQPRWFVMENVPEAPQPSVEGYAVTILALNNRWLGEEQNRLRHFSCGNVDIRRHVEVALFESPLVEQAVCASNDSAVPVRIGDSGKVKRTAIKPPVVLAGHGPAMGQRVRGIEGRSWQDMARLQGLPEGFDLPNFTVHGKKSAIGNGVPIPMARAVAKAVRMALREPQAEEDHG